MATIRDGQFHLDPEDANWDKLNDAFTIATGIDNSVLYEHDASIEASVEVINNLVHQIVARALECIKTGEPIEDDQMFCDARAEIQTWVQMTMLTLGMDAQGKHFPA